MTANLLLLMGVAFYVFGGIRFRRWAIDDRPGIPRYPASVETILLWVFYSGVVSVAIVIARQTLRQL